MMRIRGYNLEGLLHSIERQRWMIVGLALVLFTLLTLSWFLRLATAPSRWASPVVSLDPYGRPGVRVHVVYPARLGRDAVMPLTVLAQADSAGAAQPFEFVLPLNDDAIAVVDREGDHVPGRISVTPGYPDALPYDLLLVHGDTQWQGGLLRPRRVSIVPAIRLGDDISPLPELTLQVRLESRWEAASRAFATSLSGVAAPYILLAVIVGGAGWAWAQLRWRQRVAREKRLADLYSQLREQIKLERWADARESIERIRQVHPHYRDIDQLDTLISAAETAAWRREQLYHIGLQAYQSRDWPTAVQAFHTIEGETPYYRDVRFLRRTAALYVDLNSRDRSQRVAAARELGEVADLVDMVPLINSLGDPADEVADAASASFRRIGLPALDALIAGLAHSSLRVREKVYALIQGLGQSTRESLVGALHASDPRITSAAARLLANLGATKELVAALAWAPREHQEGLVQSLVSEGAAASGALIEGLLQAPPERQQLLINALAALKSEAEIDRRLSEAVRSAQTPAQRELLQRALAAQPTTFRMADEDSPSIDLAPERTEPSTRQEAPSAPLTGRWPRLRRGHNLLDNRS